MSGYIDDNVNLTISTMRGDAAEKARELLAQQVAVKNAFQADQEEAINPFAAKFAMKEKKAEPLKTRVQKMAETGEKAQLLPIEHIKDAAEKFAGKNPQEFRASVLMALREQIKPGDTKEDILRKLAEFYPDATLADEVFSFLLETTDGELARVIQEAKEEFAKSHEREIVAGRNISAQAREAAGKGLGTATSLRDMYREITGNPRDSPTLFEELSTKYAFKDLKKVIDFLLHSLGADLKSKGPSIPRGMLHRLLSETRSLQAILGVYRFFRARMPLVEKLFTQEDLELPAQLTFENMAKQFMTLAADRYPSGAKVLQLAVKLGIEKWIMAKIIAFSQLRDAIREVALNQIYKSVQHRDELYMAILEALEDLEDELEELTGKEEEEEEGEGGKKKKKKQDDEE